MSGKKLPVAFSSSSKQTIARPVFTAITLVLMASMIQHCEPAHASSMSDDESTESCCRDESTMDARVKSAQNIINDIDALKASMRTFHQHAEILIAQTKRLQGQAEVLQTKTPILPAAAKLSGAQLKAAQDQYSADLNNFALHAGAYDQHLKTFQATVGECHANQQALNNVIKSYEIHTDQFHLPTIAATLRPPHICKRMQNAFGDMSHEANSMMMDQKRLMEAQLELQKSEANLQNAETEAAGTHLKATNEAKREEGEQALAAEFNRLKDEYDLLKVEKQTLAGNNQSLGKVTRSSVSAKVKRN